jgi:flagellar biosynthesis GTPase FlhF
MKTQLPISYLTTGQNVPEDIEEATKNRILKLLFSKN